MQDYIQFMKRLAKQCKEGKRAVATNSRVFIGDVYKELLSHQLDGIVTFKNNVPVVSANVMKTLEREKIKVHLAFEAKSWFFQAEVNGFVFYNFIHAGA